MKRRVEVPKDVLQKALDENPSAHSACKALGMMYTTFIRRCKEYGIYKTNQGGRGTRKPRPGVRIPIEKIFSGEHFATGKMLKTKLIDGGFVKNECSKCFCGPEWRGEPLTLQIDHIDGDRINNARENLRLLCPNCHSQTHTFSRGKNKANALVVEW